MPKYVYYDRRSVTAKETQFFHESRVKHADKEIGTNMELDAQMPTDFTVKKIIVQVPIQLLSSATARDKAIEDQLRILLEEAILQVQVGTGAVMYFPLLAALGNAQVTGDLEYSLATAADGSYGFLNVGAGNGKYGLDVDFVIPAKTIIKVFLKTKTTPALGTVTLMFEGEKP